LATAAAARTWSVPSVAPTIQAGIDSAAAGDTVLVAAGTYTGQGNRNITWVAKDLVVRSTAGPDATIVDLELASGEFGFYIDNVGATGALDGFTIVHGRGPLEHTSGGAGVHCQRSDITLRNLVVQDCAMLEAGGGIGIGIAGSPTITHCIVQGCRAGGEG